MTVCLFFNFGYSKKKGEFCGFVRETTEKTGCFALYLMFCRLNFLKSVINEQSFPKSEDRYGVGAAATVGALVVAYFFTRSGKEDKTDENEAETLPP